jgi:nitroimidazol reductase NimA-like FMN-containing flavoprotein (pyridoxamine 5'-phosphate oxidase superfamily)
VQRRRDTEHRLTHDVDVWVASASGEGVPYLVPLSFDWDDESLLVATPTNSPTGRNLAAGRGAPPRRIQAWREVDELPDRELMRDGRWLV